MKKLCIITESAHFDPMIQQFRRAGIDAHKKATSSNIVNFDVIIVDLSYPKDLAYTFLTNIKKLPDYSDKIILSVISSRSQLTKLRSIALGSDGYISPSISYSELLEKIKGLEDPSKYLIRKKINHLPCEITYQGLLSHISENGCLIKSKVALEVEQRDLKINSTLLQEMRLPTDMIFVPSKSNPTAKRSFISEVLFLNLDEEDRQKIRQVLLSWRAK